MFTVFTELHSLDAIFPFFFSFLAWTPASCQNQKTTTLVVNLATFWCINFKNKQTRHHWFFLHLFSGGNVNHVWHLRALPPRCSASYFMLAHYFQEPRLLLSPALSLSPFALLTFSPPSSSPSIHLLSAPLSGARAVVCKAYLGCGVSLEMSLVCI